MAFSDARFDVNLSILFTELPLLERPAAAAAAGFTAWAAPRSTPCTATASTASTQPYKMRWRWRT